MKKHYFELMERVLSAYSDEDIDVYFESEQRTGLTDQGFPRLTANIGRMLARGKKNELVEKFIPMMDFCCERVSVDRSANDFSVQELVDSISALEKSGVINTEKINSWKKALSKKPIYNNAVETPDEISTNWCLFAAVSEFLRMKAGICPMDMEYIDIQLATQVTHINELGMYRDDDCPMVYDLVPRMLFCVLLYHGYDGKYKTFIDDVLRRAAFLTLRMQSVTGEIPYGGRSNQMYYNEVLLAAICEYEADRYAKEGNDELASQFKKAANDALRVMVNAFEGDSLRHVKNRFPIRSQYGCEGYAYFNKYMVTISSFLNWAMLFCRDDIKPSEKPYITADVLTLSDDFHKTFLRFGDYFAEFDTCADENYDSSGLGRIHKRGALSAICLSCVGIVGGNVHYDTEDRCDFAIVPAILKNGEPVFKTQGEYRLISSGLDESCAWAEFTCDIDGENVLFSCAVGNDKVTVSAKADGEVAIMLPAFEFDGENRSEISAKENALSISFGGCTCQYSTDGKIFGTKMNARNRNGHYRIFYAKGENVLSVCVKIK